MQIRPGDTNDVPAVLALGDEAVAWMVSQGNTGQWGTQPWSASAKRVERITGLVEAGDVRIAIVDDVPAGVLITSSQPPDEGIEPAGEPELYVRLLLTSRRFAGQKIGSTLLAYARSQAEAQGLSLLRVDCYRGGTGDLVRYYERNGFVRTQEFTVGDWPGQVLEQRW